MQALKGYRTVIFNVIMGAIAFVNQVWGTDIDPVEVEGQLNAVSIALIGLWSTGNVVLRAITDTPIGKKS